jgi:hypothetical protein
MQRATRLHLPHPRNHPDRPATAALDRALVGAAVKAPPAFGSSLVPLPSGPCVDAASETPRVLMLAERLTRSLIPGKLAGAGSRHRAQDDLAPHRFKVAEQLLSLIASPDQTVLRTAPRTTQPPRPVQLPAAYARAFASAYIRDIGSHDDPKKWGRAFGSLDRAGNYTRSIPVVAFFRIVIACVSIGSQPAGMERPSARRARCATQGVMCAIAACSRRYSRRPGSAKSSWPCPTDSISCLSMRRTRYVFA